MARPYPSNLPSQYAADKLSTAQRRDRGAVGNHLRAWWPTLFPGVPYAAALGFASNASETEDTAQSASPASFHELGMFGITGGPSSSLPAPNTSSAASNDWHELHADPRVRRMLGRSACMTAGCWTSIPDQTAVGVASLRKHADGAKRGLGVIAPTEGSPWLMAMTFWSWSAGGGRVRQLLAPLAPVLADVPEAERFNVLGRLLARLYREGSLDSRRGAGGHGSIAYGWIRTAQKLRVAEALGPAAYWTAGTADDRAWVDDVMAAAATGADLRQWPPAPPMEGGGGSWKVPAVALAVAGGLAAGWTVATR